MGYPIYVKKIVFKPASQEHADIVAPPKPARLYKEDWWERTESFYDSKNLYSNYQSNLTVKHCIPFRDSLFAGYIQESWQDIRFDFSDETQEFNYTFPIQPDIIGHREHSSMPMGGEFYPVEFIIRVPWIPQTPKGWSVLITQPFNRPELPFFAPSGIIDSDKMTDSAGMANFPVYLRKDAPSIIRSGTPLYQIIPFKRDDWKSELSAYDELAQKKMLANLRKSFWGGYKRLFWQKKIYK